MEKADAAAGSSSAPTKVETRAERMGFIIALPNGVPAGRHGWI